MPTGMEMGGRIVSLVPSEWHLICLTSFLPDWNVD